jgi:hypothetical protein
MCVFGAVVLFLGLVCFALLCFAFLPIGSHVFLSLSILLFFCEFVCVDFLFLYFVFPICNTVQDLVPGTAEYKNA